MRAFRPRGERYVARLEEVEREVVAQLATDVAEVLGATPVQLAAAQGGEEVSDGEESGIRVREAAAWDVPPLGGVDHVLASLADPSTPAGERGPSEPVDPALRRLLPSASDDAEVAAEFRRFTQVDLRAHKIDRLLALVAALEAGAAKERLAVPKERADLLAGALVDIRLVIAERLGLDSDASADALYSELADAEAGDGPDSVTAALRLQLATAYAALTWLQESLVTAQLADLDG
ncbi:MAG: DUF2017 family protein [Actinomycetales bacterium]|nr:DUF2017 family protein [Actinomycetales bacterium]